MAVDNLPTFDTYAVEDNSKRGSQMQPFVYLLAMVGATVDAASAANQVAPPPPVPVSSEATLHNVVAVPAPYHQDRVPLPRDNPGKWVGPGDYPLKPLAENIEGVTHFTLEVNAQGLVSNCVITVSSGSSELDATTCEKITQRARFYPAKDRKGKPVAGSYSNSVRWQIPKDNDLPIPGTNTLVFVVEKDGSVSKCEARKDGVLQTENSPCSANPAFEVPLDANGNPVRKQFVVSIVVKGTELSDQVQEKGPN